VRRLTVVALAALLLLTGCSGSGTAAKSTGSTPGTSATASPSPSAAATASAADIASLAAVKVDGPFGSAPTITLTQPFTISTTVARVVAPGTGEDLKKGQALQINYVGVNAKDGSAVGDNFKTKPDVFVLGEADLMAAINNVLVGQKVGVRALVAVVDTTNQTTTVLSMDVISAKSILSRAEGTTVAPVDGLPAVTLASDGKPSVTLPAATKPAALVAQDLITGAGPVVQSGQTITVHYTGWTWDGNAFDSSWDKGSTFSTTIGSGEVIKGWETGLIGKAVGSQVLLVVPPDQGYGTSANGPIPGGSTLVFVVDILNAS